MKYLFGLGIFIVCFNHIQAQDSTHPLKQIAPAEIRTEMAKTITPEDLKQHLSILASDEMEGRETGTAGNEKAAKYLSDKMEQMGLQTVTSDGTYYQPISMQSQRWEKIDMTINGKEYRHIWDFFALHEGNSGTEDLSENEIIFVGYGIADENLDNYKKTDVSGKTLLMYGGEPMDENGHSIITGSSAASTWTTDPFRKINLAKEKGAEMVYIISENFKEKIADNRRFLMGPQVSLKPPGELESSDEKFRYIFINPEMAKNMVGKKLKKVKKYRKKNARKKSTKGFVIPVDIDGHMIKRAQVKTTANVVGVLPGKSKKQEYIIVTAHFDHLGKRGNDIFNGADDNGSGTSAVLELIEAFTTASAFDLGPERSIIFLLVSGEEKGLLGSKFYTDYPLIPLDQTMVNVNIDMIGRVDKLHDDPNYVYVIGSDRLSTTLHEVNEMVNSQYENLQLDYKYNAKDDPNRYYYRSDHYNFAVKGIPAIFFFNGTHDDYHRPSDTIEKIDFDKMSKISRHIFQLIWELGNRTEPIEVNVFDQ